MALNTPNINKHPTSTIHMAFYRRLCPRTKGVWAELTPLKPGECVTECVTGSPGLGSADQVAYLPKSGMQIKTNKKRKY